MRPGTIPGLWRGRAPGLTFPRRSEPMDGYANNDSIERPFPMMWPGTHRLSQGKGFLGWQGSAREAMKK